MRLQTFKNKIGGLISEAMVSNIDPYALMIEDNIIGLYKHDELDFNSDDLYDNINDAILAGMEVEESETQEGVYEISGVWAKDGFGPILYMIAMELYGSITPANKITKDDKNVWRNFYDGKGSKFVTFSSLPDPESAYHDEEYLNLSYDLSKRIKLNKSIKNHKEFIKNDKYGEIETSLLEAIDSKIINAMRNIYG